jgi:hypothetical protein
MAAPSARLSTPSVTLDHNKWPELAADRLASRAMLRSGVRRAVLTTARRLRHPRRPAHRAHTHGPKRPMAATNAAIQNSMQQLAATTRLGVKTKIYPNSLRLSEPNPNPNRLSDSYPALVH